MTAHLLRGNVHSLDTQSEDTGSSSGVVAVSLVVIGRDLVVHSLESFRSSLDSGVPLSSSRVGDASDGRHTLQGGRELISSPNVDLGFVRGILRVWLDVVTFGEFPVESGKGGLLHGVTDDRSVFEQDKRVGSGKSERGVLSGLRDGDELLRVFGADISPVCG
jgi:hypothetical protein